MTRIQYEFVGCLCNCPTHPVRVVEEAGAVRWEGDWELLTIAFPHQDIATVEPFLKRLARALQLPWRERPPTWAPTDHHAYAATKDMPTLAGPEFEEPGSRDAWAAWAPGPSIFEPMCVTPGCPNYGRDPHTGKKRETARQDLVVHAPSPVIDAFLGCLYDWNHGADEEAVLDKAPFEVLVAARRRQQ